MGAGGGESVSFVGELAEKGRISSKIIKMSWENLRIFSKIIRFSGFDDRAC